MVMEILGPGSDTKKPGTRYSFENENVFVSYALNDESADECVKKLQPDIVLDITVIPKLELTVDALDIDQKQLRTIPPSHGDAVRSSALIDDEDGLVISINRSVEQIVYLPSKTERMRCSRYYGDLSRFVWVRIICRLCPTISVACPEEAETATKITFTANVAIGTPVTEVTYNWTVNEGTILEGQGTASIKVDTTKLAGETITATVEVSGIDPSCPRTASCSTPVVKRRKRSQN